MSKQIGRHDAACQGCPRRVSRSPEACFWVVARAVRFSQPAVLSALLAIQLFGIVVPPPYFPLKSTKRSAAAIIRSQRSFITFHSALRIILLLAELSAVIQEYHPILFLSMSHLSNFFKNKSEKTVIYAYSFRDFCIFISKYVYLFKKHVVYLYIGKIASAKIQLFTK